MTRSVGIRHRFFRTSKVLAILVVLALALASFSFPSQSFAANGYLEDCDFDGFDDTTHAPVPWYGFDGTKGDTVPGDWDGVAGSYAKKSTSTSTPPASNNVGGSAPAAATQTPVQNAPVYETAAGNDGNAQSVATDGATDASIQQSGAEINDAATPLANLSPVVAAIIGVKGTLEVAPQSGNSYTPGSVVVIKGAKFAGSVNDLQITISSDNPELLASVASSLDGSFEATINLPDNLEPGKHDIIISYQDNPIVKRTIDVVATAAAAPTGDNLIVGIALLLALAIIAAGALLGWAATKKKRTG